jgi:hypothetical protein
MRLHGIVEMSSAVTAQSNWFYEVVAPGYKYN